MDIFRAAFLKCTLKGRYTIAGGKARSAVALISPVYLRPWMGSNRFFQFRGAGIFCRLAMMIGFFGLKLRWGTCDPQKGPEIIC